MIIEGGSIPGGTTVDADVCVVGGGPAGLTVAKALDGTRFRVYVLETGGEHPTAESRAMSGGESVGHPYFPLEESRSRVLGGSSYIWEEWMRARPLDPVDFESRPWVAHSGWPLSRDVLDRYYPRAQEELGLGEFGYEPALGDTALEKWDDEAGVRPVRFRYSDTADFTTHRGWLEASRNVCLVLGANVLEVVAAERESRVDHVEAAADPGHRFSVKGRVTVLAGGGIENPRMLLLSPTLHSAMGDSLGNVGRYFMEHPRVGIGFVDSPELVGEGLLRKGGRERIAFAPTQETMEREEILNGMVLLAPASRTSVSEVRRSLAALAGAARGKSIDESTFGHVANVATSPIELARLLRSRLIGASDRDVLRVSVTVEQAPDPASLVRLGSVSDRFGQPLPELHWHLGEAERRTVRAIQIALRDALEQSGLGTLTGLLGDETPERVFRGEWHQLGTTRMSLEPRSGVVDADCRLHGVDGLYVAGGSVFPTVGYANPTLTIVALSMRLADHLESRLEGSGMGPIW